MRIFICGAAKGETYLDEKKTELFETSSVKKSVASMSVPSVISTVVVVLYNMADLIFVGLAKDPVQTAAVSLSSTVLLSFFAVNNLFGIGASTMVSRCLGKKDTDSAKRAAAFGFWMALICAALIAAGYTLGKTAVLHLIGADETTFDATSRYLFWTVSCGAPPAILSVVLSHLLRSEGESAQASVGVTVGCVLNMILDPFFVLPRFLGMGAEGAGLASLIGNCTAVLYLLSVVFRKRRTTVVCIDPRYFGFRKDIVKEVFTVGVPAAVQNLLNVASSTVLFKLTSAYGAAAVSAVGVAHRISELPNYIAQGVGQGMMPLVGYNYAAGNKKRARESVSLVMKVGLGAAALILVYILIMARLLIMLFINDPEVVRIGQVILREMILLAPFSMVDFLAVGVYQAIGKGGYSLAYAVLRKLLLEIPALLLLNLVYPLYGMGFASPIAELAMCIVSAVLLRRIFSDRKTDGGADRNGLNILE